MCVLTYISAPWAVGVLYRSLRFRPDLKAVYVALCLWLFSAAWSSNLILSSILYWATGCLWSLTGSAEGATFAFRLPGWFQEDQRIPLRRLMLYALPFALLAAWLTGTAIWYCWAGLEG